MSNRLIPWCLVGHQEQCFEPPANNKFDPSCIPDKPTPHPSLYPAGTPPKKMMNMRQVLLDG
eukprot:scaffold17459_cov54-Attheya_sp.AAC.11